MNALFALVVVAFALVNPAHGQLSQQELEAQLRAACEVRMQELRRLEQERLANVRWQEDARGARAEYAGYAPEYTCVLRDPSGETPVGRMQYQEIYFEKQGATVAAAMKATPQALRIEDVTQVFVYRDGAWR